jgi:hypothetical protein
VLLHEKEAVRLHEDEGLVAMIKHPTDYQLPVG